MNSDPNVVLRQLPKHLDDLTLRSRQVLGDLHVVFLDGRCDAFAIAMERHAKRWLSDHGFEHGQNPPGVVSLSRVVRYELAYCDDGSVSEEVQNELSHVVVSVVDPVVGWDLGDWDIGGGDAVDRWADDWQHDPHSEVETEFRCEEADVQWLVDYRARCQEPDPMALAESALAWMNAPDDERLQSEFIDAAKLAYFEKYGSEFKPRSERRQMTA